MRYFSEIVSKSCSRRISFYFKHKSQCFVNVKFVNILNFHFFNFFPCIFCSINCSNSLPFFACKFFSVLFEWCFPRQYSHNLSNYVRMKNIEFLNHPYWKCFWLYVKFQYFWNLIFNNWNVVFPWTMFIEQNSQKLYLKECWLFDEIYGKMSVLFFFHLMTVCWL